MRTHSRRLDALYREFATSTHRRRRAQGKAIHRHPVKRRQISVRHDVLPKNPTQRSSQWAVLSQKRLHMLKDAPFGFGRGEHGCRAIRPLHVRESETKGYL